MKFFLTHSTQHLRRSFKRCGCDIGRYETYTFADGERGYRLKEKVNNESVAIIASILPNPESLFELMAPHRLANKKMVQARRSWSSLISVTHDKTGRVNPARGASALWSLS